LILRILALNFVIAGDLPLYLHTPSFNIANIDMIVTVSAHSSC